MARTMINDLDYLAAHLHGRRSRLAEGRRLESLCRVPEVPELSRAVYPDSEFHAVADFQRRLAQNLVRELSGFLKHLDGPGVELLSWMLIRFQVENMKVLARACKHRIPLVTPDEFLLSLPHNLALDTKGLLAAESPEKFAELLPAGTPRKSLRDALQSYRDRPGSFFLETALDRGYLQELLDRGEKVSGEDKELIKPIVLQEVDAFHLMLIVRGKFHYGLGYELLSPLRVHRSGISRERFTDMLAAADVPTAASLAVGRAIDALPPERGSSERPTTVDPSTLEALTWKRYLRLSNRAFRRSHMGLAAVIGYVGIRRVEVANLITLSEGIRAGVVGENIRARLIPRADLESVYV